MSNCSKCGSPLPDGAKFCPSCNKRILTDTRRPMRNAPTTSAVPEVPAAAPVPPRPVSQPTVAESPVQRPTPAPSEKPEQNTYSQSPSSDNIGFIGECIREIFGFKFSGRLNRARFWKYTLVLYLFIIIVLLFLGLANAKGETLAIFILLLSILHLPLSVRRIHDLDKSGWWLLCCLIPYVNIVACIYICFFKGTDGPNRFGPDPLG